MTPCLRFFKYRNMENQDGNIRIRFDNLKSEFIRVLLKYGFSEQKGDECAEIFAQNSLDGVSSHGINRFSRFIKNIHEGLVKPDEVPSLVNTFGSIEQWDGNLGPGPLNAKFATERAISLACDNGIGMLTLSNTNHWMRGGTYGWQAAKQGFVFICWTNTCRNMPAWGASDPRIGNNPLVLAVPYKDDAIVLDFAMSQYSYGKMESLRAEGKMLDFPGGYNKNGELTRNPAEILESWRVLPVGYWKGAGLSLLLDILAAVLSGGKSTHEINSCTSEYSVSQVFIAIKINCLNNFPAIDNTVNKIIDDLHKSIPAEPASIIRYPGQQVLTTRNENLKNGIPVNTRVWENLKRL
jgi:3-dehydro-L-gulonate 2-dehydrogenase